MIGKAASNPVTWGPSKRALAVTATIGTTAHAARSGRSQRGSGRDETVPGARGSSTSAAPQAAHARHSAASGPTWTGLSDRNEERRPAERQRPRPGAAAADGRIDEHERDQRHDPEQRAGRGVGCELIPVPEREHEEN